jgi:hypothetical protein
MPTATATATATAVAAALPLLVAAAAPAPPAPDCAPLDLLGVRLVLQDGQVPYALGLSNTAGDALMLFASPETGTWTRVTVLNATGEATASPMACIAERGTKWHVLPPLAPAVPEPST